MINFEEIIRKAREDYSWVIQMYKPSELHRRYTLSESSLTNHLTNYSNVLFNVNNFLAWGNDPRKVEIGNLPDSPKLEDTRVFRQIPLFSLYYLDSAPIESPLIPTPRLNEFIATLDKKTLELNAVMPAIKHPNSDRDFIAKKFTDFAAQVLVYEKELNDAVDDAWKVINHIYSYRSGKIFVTDPKDHTQIPSDKRHLFGF